MKKVYIAAPISIGDQAHNVRKAIDAAHRLANLGYAPHVPQLTWFWQLVHPRDHASWMALDRPWLESADVVLRLPGESKGADMEVVWAMAAGIPVYYDIESLDIIEGGNSNDSSC